MRNIGSELHEQVRLGPWKVYKFGHGLTLVPEKRTTILGSGKNEDWTHTISGSALDFLLQLNIQTWFPRPHKYHRTAVLNGRSSIDMVAVDARRAAHLFWLPEQGMSVPNVLSVLKRPQGAYCSERHIDEYCQQRLAHFWDSSQEHLQKSILQRLGDHIAMRCHGLYCAHQSPKRIHLHVLAHDLEHVLGEYSSVLKQLEQSGARVSAWEWAIMLTPWGGRLALREYQLTRSLAINDLPDISLKTGAFKKRSFRYEENLLQTLNG